MKRKSAKELLDKMAEVLEQEKDTDDATKAQAVEAAFRAATYDVLCGIEEELHEFVFAMQNVNRALLAAVNQAMSVREVTPEQPKDFVPEPDKE